MTALDACRGREAPSLVDSIVLEHVTFTYPGADRRALQDVNLRFHSGRSTLLVGANGAGKTTIIKLLMRLYEPASGRILINGVDIRGYDPGSLRQQIGIMFQNYQPYAFSVRDNIGVGQAAAMADGKRIEAAARRARADSFIQTLPCGYDTPLTRMFAGGHPLSVGQWQRLALARLFMKDSPVIVLDEPCANLDVETEAALVREIREVVSARKLCIIISHRMFRPNVADHIVVLSQGEVLEQGSYDELSRAGGEFARLKSLFYATGDPDSLGAPSAAALAQAV